MPETVITFSNVQSNLALTRLEVALGWASQKNPSTGAFEVNSLSHGNLVIRLEAPIQADQTSPPVLTLYDYTTGVVSRDSLADLTFPNDRPLGSAYNEFLARIKDTRGEWKLKIRNLGAPATLDSATLSLAGQPLYDLHGRVVDANNNPVAGATVSLAGVAYNQPIAPRPGTTSDFRTDANGYFSFIGLPGLVADISASHPLYGGGLLSGRVELADRTPHFTTNNPAETELQSRFQAMNGVPLIGLGVSGFGTRGGSLPADRLVLRIPSLPPTGPPRIVADYLIDSLPGSPRGRIIGYAPLYVDFNAVNPPAGATWDFGSAGTFAGGDPPETNFALPRIYPVKLKSSAGAVLDEIEVVAMPAPGAAPTRPQDVVPSFRPEAGPYNGYYIFAPTFTGGGTRPHPDPDGNPTTNDDPVGHAVGSFTSFDGVDTVPHAELIMLQDMYCASFDIDLFPHLANYGTDFDTDRDAAGAPFDATDHRYSAHPSNRSMDKSIPGNARQIGYLEEDHNYVLAAGQWVVQLPTIGVDLGLVQSYTVEDSIYHSPVRTLPNPNAVAANQKVPGRYMMACHIGAAIVPPGVTGNSVIRPADQSISSQINSDSFGVAPNGMPGSYFNRLFIISPFSHLWVDRSNAGAAN